MLSVQIQEERALKKGLPLPHPGVDSTRTNSRYVQGTTKSPHPPTAARASLASKFIDLSPEFVLASRTTALTEPLPRPLPSGSSSFPRGWLDAGKGKAPMRVPMRPAWTYEMTKTEVEANEEEAHARWLAECAAIVDEWKHDGAERDATTWEQTADSKQTGRLNWPRSTSELNLSTILQLGVSRSSTLILPALLVSAFYETNLQVWRQLWRTTEMVSVLYSSGLSFGGSSDCLLLLRAVLDPARPPRHPLPATALSPVPPTLHRLSHASEASGPCLDQM